MISVSSVYFNDLHDSLSFRSMLEGCVEKTWLQLDGKAPSGLLTFFGPEPLKAAELAADSQGRLVRRRRPRTAGAAVRLNRRGAEQDRSACGGGVRQGRASGGGRDGFWLKGRPVRAAGRFLVHLQCMPGEGGLVFTGLTVVVPIKDRERLLCRTTPLVQPAQASMLKENITPQNPHLPFTGNAAQ